jgi:hypothetical protein
MVTRQSQNVAPAIDWDEVLTPPQELAAATRELIPAAASLSAADLEQVAISIRDRPELWEPLLVIDVHRRRYRLLFEDERTDIWVLCWMPGQSTGFHDHDISDVGIAIAQGMIVERQLRLPSIKQHPQTRKIRSRDNFKPSIDRRNRIGFRHGFGQRTLVMPNVHERPQFEPNRATCVDYSVGDMNGVLPIRHQHALLDADVLDIEGPHGEARFEPERR